MSTPPIGIFVPFATQTDIQAVTVRVDQVDNTVSAATTGLTDRTTALEAENVTTGLAIGTLDTRVTAVETTLNESGTGVLARLDTIQNQGLGAVNIPWHNPVARYKAGDVVKVRATGNIDASKTVENIYYANSDIDGTVTSKPFVVGTGDNQWSLLTTSLLPTYDFSKAYYTGNQLVVDNGIPYFLSRAATANSPRPRDSQDAAALVHKWITPSTVLSDGFDYYLYSGSLSTSQNYTLDIPAFSRFGVMRFSDPFHEIGRTANSKITINCVNGTINGATSVVLDRAGTCVEIYGINTNECAMNVSYTPKTSTVTGLSDWSTSEIYNSTANARVTQTINSSGAWSLQQSGAPNPYGISINPTTRRLLATETPTGTIGTNNYITLGDANGQFIPSKDKWEWADSDTTLQPFTFNQISLGSTSKPFKGVTSYRFQIPYTTGVAGAEIFAHTSDALNIGKGTAVYGRFSPSGLFMNNNNVQNCNLVHVNDDGVNEGFHLPDWGIVQSGSALVICQGAWTPETSPYTDSSRFYYFSTEQFSTMNARSGDVNLGSSSARWKGIFSTTSLNVSSDERLKKDIADIPDALLDVWHEHVQFKSFKRSDIESKKIAGVIAQDVIAAFDSAGLDWQEWEIITTDDNGYYGVSYDDVLVIELAAMRKKLLG